MFYTEDEETPQRGKRRGRRRGRHHGEKPSRPEPRPIAEGTITRIATQRRNPNRASVFIDNEFAFGVFQGILLEYGLHSGKRLTVAEQNTLLKSNALLEARSKALEYLTGRLRSEHELREKLHKKEFAPDVIEQTIHRIKELGYINDAHYAEAFSRERLNINRYGKRRIRRDLIKRGVANPLIEAALSALDDHAILDAARRAAGALRKRLRVADLFARRQKLYAHLARRGFDPDVIRIILDEFKAEEEQTYTREPHMKPSEQKPTLSLDEVMVLARKRHSTLERLERSPRKREQKLKDFLRRRSVPFDLIKQALDLLAEEAPDEPEATLGGAEEGADDDFDEIIALAQNRWGKLMRLESNQRKRRQKLKDFLRRRSIPFEQISRLFDEGHIE